MKAFYVKLNCDFSNDAILKQFLNIVAQGLERIFKQA